MLKNMFTALCCLLAACPAVWGQSPVRIGTYDSRAIAVAYAHSDTFHQWLTKLIAEQKQAKAAGDEKRVHEIEARGKAQQERFHQQGFRTASVLDLMAAIRPEIPTLAKDAGVVLVVSKWEVLFRDPAIEYVDVTIPLVKKMGADAKVLQMIEELMKHEPVQQ